MFTSKVIECDRLLINRTLWDIKTRAWKDNKRLLRGDDPWAVCLEVSRSSSDEPEEGQAQPRDQQLWRFRGVKQHGAFGT